MTTFDIDSKISNEETKNKVKHLEAALSHLSDAGFRTSHPVYYQLDNLLGDVLEESDLSKSEIYSDLDYRGGQPNEK